MNTPTTDATPQTKAMPVAASDESLTATDHRTPTTERSFLTGLGWLAVGLVAPLGGAAIAVLMTFEAIKDSTDDFAGLIVIFTAPAGYLVGVVCALLAARSVEKQSKSVGNLLSRSELVFLGFAVPVFLVVAVPYALSQFG